MYLLDTNVISEMRKIKQGKADKNVVKWLQSIDPNLLYTSIIVLMEVERGILLKQRKDKVQAEHLQFWLDNIIRPTFQNRTKLLTHATANICATLYIPNPKQENDAWIGATAIEHGFTVVTRNIKDFAGMNVKIINPFDDMYN